MRASRRLAPSTAAAVLVAALVASLLAVTPAGARAESGDRVPGRLLVQFDQAATREDRAAARAAAGAKHLKSIAALGVDVLEVAAKRSATAQAALLRNPHVVSAETDAVARIADTIPNDTTWSAQWSPVKTRATKAWDITTGKTGVVVAVLDTGVAPSHPDLQGKLVSGWNVIAKSSNSADDHGHGTMVAGVIGAVTNNAANVASYCWQCKVMPVKVAGSNGVGYASDLAAGITWAVDHGARVVNISMAGSGSTSAMASAVKYAADRNVLVTAAAGNEGSSTAMYPAAYADVVGVAASAADDTLTGYSNRGSWVDVAAPGDNYTTTRSGSYGRFTGTSSATPVVAGIAGLAFSTGSVTVSQVRKAMNSTAVRVSGVAYGRVDTYGTVSTLAGSAPSPEPSPSPSPTPSPSPSPEPAPVTTTTTTFSATMNGKHTTKSYSVSAGTGKHEAALKFTKAASMSLAVYNASGTKVGAASGASVLKWSADLAKGTYTYQVSGPAKASFTLTIVRPSP